MQRLKEATEKAKTSARTLIDMIECLISARPEADPAEHRDGE